MRINDIQLDSIQYILQEYTGYVGPKENIALINIQDKVDISPNKWGIHDLFLVKGNSVIRAESKTLEGNPSTKYRILGLNERLDQIVCVFPRFIPGVCC